jgi:hypothetical protein
VLIRATAPGLSPRTLCPPSRRRLDSKGQDLKALAMNVARVWGDLLGVEVGVRTLRGRKLRVEVVFNSAEAALAVGGRQAEAVARGSKRR